jgi:hypothetical protein
MKILSPILAIENIIYAGLTVHLYNGTEVLIISRCEDDLFETQYSEDYLNMEYTVCKMYWYDYRNNILSLKDKIKSFISDSTEVEIVS